jgi:hypothetical protein
MEAGQSDDLVGALKSMYDSDELRVLTVSGDFSWDRVHDGPKRFQLLNSAAGRNDETDTQTVVVALGANANLATAAFLKNDHIAVHQIQLDYMTSRGSPRCPGICLIALIRSRLERQDDRFDRITSDLAAESAKSRILLVQIADGASAATRLVDLTRIATHLRSPEREACIGWVLHTSVRIGFDYRNVPEPATGSLGSEAFHRVLETLGLLIDNSAEAPRKYTFRLVEIPDGTKGKTRPPWCSSYGALDVAMRSLMSQSRDALAAAASNTGH